MIPRCFISNHIYSQHAVQYGVGGIFKVFFLCDDVHSAGDVWRGVAGRGLGGDVPDNPPGNTMHDGDVVPQHSYTMHSYYLFFIYN